MRPPLEHPPTGTITFLFSDIEGSTQLVRRLGDAWPELLERHRQLLRGALAERGWEVGTEGDSFFFTFERATDAVTGAAAAQRALASAPWPPEGRIRVRMGLHTGLGTLSDAGYVGLDVHRAARIAAAGHGGQVVLSGSTAALVEHDLPPDLQIIDLGEHLLKDLPQPEHLHQLVVHGLPSAFPPLRSLVGQAQNLPVALSSFMGRDHEVADVRALLATARLVTITGPGGTGKTRLAQEVARQAAADLAGGSTFVPLEALRDANLIPVEILRALRRDTATSTSPRDRVAAALSEHPTLLVLDNLEQLAGAAGVVRDLLASIPGLTVLASSQAALRISGEHEYPLQPLPRNAAVDVFVERARAARPDFELDDDNRATVQAICERLDGLPLAIELAAAQVRLLPPATILARIGDRLDALTSRQQDLPERQRTLRATVTWSYDLLSEPEQAFFRRLSVFVGGATIAEIEAFEERRGRGADALDTLQGLVDRSLVAVRRISADENRFGMLETVRTVARELLREQGEDAEALDAHAEVFRQLAAQAEPELYGSTRGIWLDRLAADHDNLRAALDHLVAAGDLTAALEIAADLWRFWQTRGHLLEGWDRLRPLLASAGDGHGIPLTVLSRAEEAAGSTAYWLRTVSGAAIEPHYRRSVELARASGDRNREAWALYNLAFAYDFVPISGTDPIDPVRGRQLREEALELFRATGDQRGIGESLWALGGNADVIRRDPDAARAQLAEAARLLGEIDDSYGASWAFTSLGMLESYVGNLEAGRAAILAGAELFLRDDDMAGQIMSIQDLGSIAARQGDDQTAARLCFAAQEMGRKVGVDVPQIQVINQPLQAAIERLSAEEIQLARDEARLIEARPFLEAALAARQVAPTQ